AAKEPPETPRERHRRDPEHRARESDAVNPSAKEPLESNYDGLDHGRVVERAAEVRLSKERPPVRQQAAPPHQKIRPCRDHFSRIDRPGYAFVPLDDPEHAGEQQDGEQSESFPDTREVQLLDLVRGQDVAPTAPSVEAAEDERRAEAGGLLHAGRHREQLSATHRTPLATTSPL